MERRRGECALFPPELSKPQTLGNGKGKGRERKASIVSESKGSGFASQ